MSKEKIKVTKRVSNFALSETAVTTLKMKSLELSKEHGKHISMTKIVETLIMKYLNGKQK